MGDGLRPEAVAAAASSSERDEWERVLASLVELLRRKQSQIAALVDDRKFLEDYVHLQHERWVSKTHTLESQIAQLRKEADGVKKVETAAFDYLMGLKNQEIGCYKVELDHAKTDLEDLLACMKKLCHHMPKNPTPKKSGSECSNHSEGTTREAEKRIAFLEEKLKKLKLKYKQVASEKETKVSALLSEKDFIWNQFKKADEECTLLRKTASLQVAESNEAMEKLQATIESLQSIAAEKDEMILNLKAKVASLEVDLQRQSEEAEQSRQMLAKHQKNEEELRTFLAEKDELIIALKASSIKLDSDTPETAYCKTRMQKQKSITNRRCASVDPRICQKIPYKERIAVPLTRSRLHALSEPAGLKRCAAIEWHTRGLETPRLFSSNFKIPKLKNIAEP